MHISLPAIAFVVFPALATAATIGPYQFEDLARADGLNVLSGTVSTFTAQAGPLFPENLVTPTDAISDGDLDTNVFCDVACSFEVFFSDNVAVNGTGFDIVLFEEGGNEDIQVTINGITQTLLGASSIDIGVSDSAGVPVEAYEIDLSDFSVASGGSVSSFFIDPLNTGGRFSSADISEIVANPSVIPVPPAMPLLAFSLGAFWYLGRRKRVA